MRKIAIFCMTIMLVGCDSFGSKKVKNIIELTPKLSEQSKEAIITTATMKDLGDYNISKSAAYNITRNKIIAEPAFAKGVAYFIDNKAGVYAFSKKTKKMLWSHNISTKDQSNYIGGGITFNEGKLYITNGSRFLVILDAESGHELFRKEFPDIIRTKPAILSKDVVIVQTVSNQIIAYDMVKSSTLWQHDGLFETIASSTYINPIIYNGHLIACYSSGQLVVLEVKTGQEKWTMNLSEGQDVALASFETTTLSWRPIIDGDNIYIFSSLGKIMKIEIASGHIKWGAEAKDIQSATLNGNSLFITNNAKQVAAISTENGKVKWVADLEIADKKKRAVTFLAPIISKKGNNWVLHILGNNDQMYSFESKDDVLSPSSFITKTIPNIEYSGNTCCGDVYLVTDKKIIFLSSKGK